MNFIEQLDTLAMGSRIKNLGELLMKDMARVYKEHNVDFEPRWFTFFQLVIRRKEITVTEIARELNQSHPASVQVVNMLEKRMLVSTRKDKTDKRKRLVRLTKKGERLARELDPLWEDVHSVAREILEEGAPDLMERIAGIEKAIERKSTYDRIREKQVNRITNEIKYIPYTEAYRKEFKRLNEDWLNEYLNISPHDKKVLSNPQNEIIKKGGKIVLMALGKKVIGTYVLQIAGDNECELSKFTISKDYRGMGLGRKMLLHAMDKAKNMECRTILLFTHHKLPEATKLYTRLGFEEINGHPGLIDKSGRCSMMMKYIIKH